MTMKRNTRWILAAATVTALAALTWAFAPKPVPVETAAVEVGRFEAAIEEEGRTRIRDSFTVSAPLAGRLARITLREGDVVTAGQVLALLSPQLPSLQDARTVAEGRARLQAADAGVAVAQARLDRSGVAVAQARHKLARSEGLAVFPYSPLGGGLLSGKYGVQDRPTDGRVATWPMYQTRYGAEDHFALAERFRALAAEAGWHPATLAVAWVMRHPGVTAPILGATRVEQLEPALAAAERPLPDDLYARVSALWPAPPPATDRNEEGKVPGPGVATQR
jgi:pyruvate/2-oxoglutarate dehydrogenase complex dihydrolipoamide acyltransferase (E2) component